MRRAKQIFVAGLFGAIISLTKVFLVFPLDKMFIVVQAVLLALSALFIRRFGASYVGAVDGLLSSLWRPALGPFTFLFSFLYGVLIDGLFYLFRVQEKSGNARRGRLILAMTISTGLIGFLSYYVTAVATGVMPMEESFAAVIIVMGTISGGIAGYVASFMWNKHLKNMLLEKYT